ncbi:hypothetical protein [Nocardiopsis kunsanensis]|uniref:DUF2613 family protein n=1 Tax=Nocardiopsis kunsanensis TaxID=141693 RepID=A0A918XBF8_9ACTN|nr:hypothetical protein [Nocardiopsis kunsanensis]GHD24773.1 hypothetical protein GCM10007147_21350 [Nocardiopsis kunsanensis]
MGVTTKLGLYALGLVAVFGAMFGVGSLVGPVLPGSAPEHSVEQLQDSTADTGGNGGREETR